MFLGLLMLGLRLGQGILQPQQCLASIAQFSDRTGLELGQLRMLHVQGLQTCQGRLMVEGEGFVTAICYLQCLDHTVAQSLAPPDEQLADLVQLCQQRRRKQFAIHAASSSWAMRCKRSSVCSALLTCASSWLMRACISAKNALP